MSLGRIFGTEEDKVNCSFYFKIGACRHGDRCSRLHNRPNFSQSILVPHMYSLPETDPQTGKQPDLDEHFADFCDDVMEELTKFGKVEELNVCKNLGEHMFGNVYVKFSAEEEAEEAMKALRGRFFNGRILHVEYSPVTDFRESRCRQYEDSHCNRGGFCNFMHLFPTPEHLRGYFAKVRALSKNEGMSGRRRSRSGSSRESRHGSHRQIEEGERVRNNSPERRALIARWNEERQQALLAKEQTRRV